jgi:hypothetical protein
VLAILAMILFDVDPQRDAAPVVAFLDQAPREGMTAGGSSRRSSGWSRWSS